MAPADDDPARAHDDAAPASLAPAAAAAAPPPPPPPPPHPHATTTTTSSSAPATASPPQAAAAAAPGTAASGTAAPQPPATSPADWPSTAAAAAPRPQQNGDSRAEANGMSGHSSALHGVAVGYPAATTASSSMSPASAYMPMSGLSSSQYSSYPTTAAASQPADVYGASPVGSSAPMSLPSMRTIDAMSQQPVAQPPAPHHAMSMGMSPPLASAPSGQGFYAHHSLALPSSYGLPHEAMARYPIPHDPRILGTRGPKKVRLRRPSAGPVQRPNGRFENLWKKSRTANMWILSFCAQEIKRRTKTGCLTCRKRRIKVGNFQSFPFLAPFLPQRCQAAVLRTIPPLSRGRHRGWAGGPRLSLPGGPGFSRELTANRVNHCSALGSTTTTTKHGSSSKQRSSEQRSSLDRRQRHWLLPTPPTRHSLPAAHLCPLSASPNSTDFAC